MNKKIKILAATIGIIAISKASVCATTNINYKFDTSHVKYKIILDGQSYTIPDTLEYSDGDTVSLANLKTRLASTNLKALTYADGTLKYNGNLLTSTITNEYVPLINEYGIANANIDVNILRDNFEKYQLLRIRESEKAGYEDAIEGTTDEKALKEYNFRLKEYIAEIDRINAIDLSSAKKDILSTIPYISEKYAYDRKTDEIDYDKDTLTSQIDVNYYIYDMIFRDLRLSSIKYSVNSGSMTTLANFDKDTYTYTVKLPESTPDDATITTESTGYMNSLLSTGYDLGLKVEDATVKLNNGMATVQVKNIFKVYETYGSYLDEDYTSDPERTYTINFTKYDYIKGDLDRNGVVNANDAAVALDLYKYENATDEDILIGDIDENGVINANDAALILDIYKYGN